MKTQRWRLKSLLLLVLAVLTALGLMGCKDQSASPQKADTKTDTLYWNVEKYTYSTIGQTRFPREDYYYVRFLVDGEQIDIPVADEALVKYIDTMEVMGLRMNKEGVVEEVLTPQQMGYTIVAEDDYVQSVDGLTIQCNTTGAGTGLPKTLTLTDTAPIYLVDEGGSLLCGMPGTLQKGSKILALADESGKVCCLYTMDPFQMGDVYWNTERLYNTTTKQTTRELDSLGRFAYTFSLNGEHVQLYTRDLAVANAIDAIAAKCMGLEFSEDGMITGVRTTANVTGGKSWGSWFHILNIEGNLISGKKYSGTNKGAQSRGRLAEDCKVYDVSGKGAYIGEPTQLQLYDQVHGLRNEFGEICVLFVVGRNYQADIYYNVERQYDSANKVTKRVPAADGYYYIPLAKDGQQVTLKTKDKEIVTSMDATTVRCFGLQVENGEILKFYTASSVWGGRQFCSYDIVTSISPNGTITAKEMEVEKHGEKTYTGKMSDGCGVYNVSSSAAYVGEKTTLQVGDKIHALKDLEGNVTHIFVVSPSYHVPIYWNVDRQYDADAKTTKRTPNAQGYYEITLAVDGEQKVFKTKDRDLITQIDAVATKCFGLVTNGNIITKMYRSAHVAGGIQFCSWDAVTAINGKRVTAREAEDGKLYIGNMTPNTKVYDVTGKGASVGTKTTLRVGDKIHALKDYNDNLTYVFVVSRAYNGPVYWNVERQYDADTKTTKRTPNARGYYEILLAVDGQQKTYRTKNLALINEIDAVTTSCFGLDVEGDMILKLHKTSLSVGGAQFCSWDYVTAISGNRITAEEPDHSKTYTGKLTANTKIFDVSGVGEFIGVKTTLAVGDRIHALKDKNDNLTYVFVVTRAIKSPIYWNVDRQYDSANQTTKRVPDQEGYYEVVLAVNGQQNTYRTQDLNIINAIDAAATKCFGLQVSGDIITKFYKTSSVDGGIQFCSWDVVTSITGNTVIAEESDGSQTYTGRLTENTQVYNVTGKGAFVGEKTTLEVGDKIHALKFTNGDLNVIFVVDRKEKITQETAYCQLCEQDVTWYSWDGAAAFEHEKHYFLKRDVAVTKTAYIGAAEDTQMEVTLDLRGNNIHAAVRAFRIYGTFDLLDTQGEGVIYGNASGQATGFYVYDAGTFNMYGGHFVGGESPNSQCGIGALGLNEGSNATFNMYGGSLQNGNTQKDGGNLSLYHEAVFNMYGGLIANGQTQTTGGNISAGESGQINLYGGSILGGTAVTGNCVYGGKIAIYDNAPVQVDDIYLKSAMVVPNVLAEGSKILVTLPSGGHVTGETPEANLQYIQVSKGEILWKDGKLQITRPADRIAFCAHCQQNVDWYIWKGDSTLENGNHYYLNDTVSVSETAYIGNADEKDVAVCLDLNGHSIDATVRVFRIYGNLNLMDSVGTGVITGNTAGQASVFYVYENAVFNFYGGTLTAVKTVTSTSGAGIGGIDKGTMNMYGGTITGGVAQKSGGNLNLYNTGVLNLYGGTIQNGTSLEASGGNIQLSANAKLNLYGGSILGGSAGNLGNCINANGAVTLYGQNPIQITQIYLPGTKKLSVDGILAAESTIGILLQNETGIFAETTEAANQPFFHNDQYDVLWNDGQLILGTQPQAWTAVCQHCNEETTWTVWNGKDPLETAEHYYLTEDVTLDATAYIGSADARDVVVCLDLNGHSMNATVRLFRIYGNLNLMDSVGTGVITGNTAGQASVFYVYENAVFNFYGGTMTAIKTVTSSSGAGIGGIDKGTMNMYGGTITGGVAQKSGGNLNLYNTGVLNLYGGTIQNGTSLEASGGNIQLSANAKLNLYGGSILGGSAANLGSGINANGKVTLYGDSVITVEGLYLPGNKTLALEGILAEGSSIELSLEKLTGAFTDQTQKENADFFHNADYAVAYSGSKLHLEVPEIPPEDPNAHWHCICGGLGETGDHTKCAKVVWTPWPGVDQLVLDGSMYYYLEENITVDKAIKLEEGQVLNLCLNGCSITTEQKIYIFDISGGLNICDHEERKGAVTNLYTGTSHSMAFYLRGSSAGSWFNMFGGTYSAPNGKTTGTGAAVARVGTSAGMAIFKMYGGCITGGQAASANVAGNLVLEQGSVTYLYGGSITNGNNTKGAGNVIVKNGAQMTIDGGTVSGGAGVNGENICVKSGCLLAVVSGAVTGGSIYAEGSVTVHDSAIVDSVIKP